VLQLPGLGMPRVASAGALLLPVQHQPSGHPARTLHAVPDR
jgi:hypothetical protein